MNIGNESDLPLEMMYKSLNLRGKEMAGEFLKEVTFFIDSNMVVYDANS